MAHNLANAFSTAGHRTVMVGPRGSYVPYGLPQHYHLYDDFQSNVKRRERDGVFEEDRRIGEVLSAIFAEYEIDHVLLAHPFYYGVMAIDEARKAGIAVSALFHGFEMRSQLVGGYPDDLGGLVARRQVDTLAQRAFYVVAQADELIANSSYTRAVLEGFGTGKDIHVCGCGIDLDYAEKMTNPTDSPAQPAGDVTADSVPVAGERTLAYVGRLYDHKKVDRLIDIVAAHDGLRAVIVGDGPARGKLEDLASRLASGKVRFEGAVDEVRKWEILTEADGLALLSEPNEAFGHVEGFGIVLLEGGFAGCVPVSSGTGGMVDVVQDGENGIVIAPDLPAGEAAERLYALLGPHERDRLVKNARAQVRDRYNWQAIAAEMAARWTKRSAGQNKADATAGEKSAADNDEGAPA